MIFKSWTESLPDSVEIFGFEPPGRGIRLREAAFKRIGPLVESVTAALLPYLDKPFVLFGHSMGARIVFEIARNLRRENRPMPRHLFVSGSPAPQIKDEDPPTYNLPEAEFIDEVRKLNGTPKEVLEHQELLQLMLPLLRADFEVVQTYQYTSERPLECPITALGGLQDKEVKRQDLEGWQEQTTGSFTLRMFPGNHFFLHTDQSLLMRALSQDLLQIVHSITAR